MNQLPKKSRIQPCCVRAANSVDAAEAGFCNECGNPLLRCAAFQKCGGLLEANGCCPCCFAPEMHLEADCLRQATIGGSLTIPMNISNASPTKRAVFVEGLWVREGSGEWEKCDLSWELLEAGSAKPVSITASSLDRAGTHRIEIMVALSSRWQWRKEVFAFTTGLEISVEAEKDVVVQQNIHYAADTPQTGATIYAPVRVTSEKNALVADSRSQKLPLTRAGVNERRFGFRGTKDEHIVRRDAQFRWRSFPKFATPSDGMIVTAESLLNFGRSRTKQQDGTTDVRLLAVQQDGTLDEAASREISRDHFCIWIENDRLMLRVNSNSGAWVDGEVYPRGQIVQLNHGSRFSPLKTNQQRLMLGVRFEVEHNDIVAIEITNAT